jgi:hypothetical protein
MRGWRGHGERHARHQLRRYRADGAQTGQHRLAHEQGTRAVEIDIRSVDRSRLPRAIGRGSSEAHRLPDRGTPRRGRRAQHRQRVGLRNLDRRRHDGRDHLALVPGRQPQRLHRIVGEDLHQRPPLERSRRPVRPRARGHRLDATRCDCPRSQHHHHARQHQRRVTHAVASDSLAHPAPLSSTEPSSGTGGDRNRCCGFPPIAVCENSHGLGQRHPTE